MALLPKIKLLKRNSKKEAVAKKHSVLPQKLCKTHLKTKGITICLRGQIRLLTNKDPKKLIFKIHNINLKTLSRTKIMVLVWKDVEENKEQH